MSTHEPGAQAVTILLNNVPVSTLNPLPTTGGGGGGGGMVTQGAGSGLPTGAWTTRLSNGAAFYNALTDTELRASPASAPVYKTDSAQAGEVVLVKTDPAFDFTGLTCTWKNDLSTYLSDAGGQIPSEWRTSDQQHRANARLQRHGRSRARSLAAEFARAAGGTPRIRAHYVPL